MFKYLNRGISTPIAIAIILLLAVSVGGITLWQYSEMQSEKIKPVALKSFEKDETADWKIYLNEEYGFEVEYPSEWIIIKEAEESVLFASEKETKIQAEKQAGEIRCAVWVSLYNNEKGLSLRDWAIEKWGEQESREAGKITEVKVGDLKGLKYEFMSMGMQTNILLPGNDEVINIQTTFGGCENLDAIFNGIISTFRFIVTQSQIKAIPEKIADILGRPECCSSESVDLNSDGVAEFIIFPDWICGDDRGASGNGPIYVFEKTEENWKKIGDLEGNIHFIEKNKTNEYHDISIYWHLGGGSGINKLYQWDKSVLSYILKESKKIEIGI